MLMASRNAEGPSVHWFLLIRKSFTGEVLAGVHTLMLVHGGRDRLKKCDFSEAGAV